MFDEKLQKLIIQILSDRFNQDTFNDIPDVEWHELFAFAKDQRLHVLIYTILRQSKIAIPEDLSLEMKEAYNSACVIDFKSKKQLIEIMQIFNHNNIDHILLKGAHMISFVYKTSYCRIMCDIDILVHKEDANMAYKLLTDNGYAGVSQCTDNFLNHYPPLFKTNCLNVEIHTDIAEGVIENLDRIWLRSESRIPSLPNTRIMCPEDLIFHIAFHKFHTDMALNGLLGLYDISQIIRTNRINFDLLKLFTTKKEYDNNKCLFLVMSLSKNLLNAPISDEFLNAIKPESFNYILEKKIVDLLFSDSSEFDLKTFRLNYIFAEALKNKLKFKLTLRRLFMPSEKQKIFWGDKNSIALHTKRILFLINKYKAFFFKKLSFKYRNNESIKLSGQCVKLKYWLSN